LKKQPLQKAIGHTVAAVFDPEGFRG